MPAASVVFDKVATPPLVRLGLPISLAPSSMKLTVPVGVPAVPWVMVAVSVTLWFRFAAVGELNAVVVLTFCTIWLTGDEVLGA